VLRQRAGASRFCSAGDTGFRAKCACFPSAASINGDLPGKSFDLAAALVNTARRQPREWCPDPPRSGTLALRNRFPASGKREDAMNKKNEKAARKPARDERDQSDRRAREKALDQALEDTFPASDPVARSEPAPGRD